MEQFRLRYGVQIGLRLLSNFPAAPRDIVRQVCLNRGLQNTMKALILYVGFVVAWTAAGVLISSYIERATSPQISTIVLLAMFFSGLVVSWIATVFVMDGSLNNFFAEREQIEAERVGKLYMNRTDLHD
jgi:RsiW-degrading membrane proteinase PrsW (M82 family)